MITTVHVDGIRVKGNGEAFWKDGTTGVTLPLGGTASLGPVKMDLIKLGLKSLHTMPSPPWISPWTPNSASAMLAPSYNTLVYKLQANSPMDCAEPSVDSFNIDASYSAPPPP